MRLAVVKEREHKPTRTIQAGKASTWSRIHDGRTDPLAHRIQDPMVSAGTDTHANEDVGRKEKLQSSQLR